MKATLLIFPRAEAEMLELPWRDLNHIMETLEFLCDFPRGAQTAGLEDAPEIRRAVSGNYLLYYRYNDESEEILLYTVRHGRRRPPELSEILPE
ncbi:MAG TPA: type II toxin-antitoxin system RelE/ParE family toxin [Chthonomonadaceae bacterium]|nr:type II toxin-antitoxin system RelE/ParE family toxin [Chthonomonadaceae bacterium]